MDAQQCSALLENALSFTYGHLWTTPQQRGVVNLALRRMMRYVMHCVKQWQTLLSTQPDRDHDAVEIEKASWVLDEYVRDKFLDHPLDRVLALHLVLACRLGRAVLRAYEPDPPPPLEGAGLWGRVWGGVGGLLSWLRRAAPAEPPARIQAFVADTDPDLHARIRGDEHRWRECIAILSLCEAVLRPLYGTLEGALQGRTPHAHAVARIVGTCTRLSTLRRRLYRWYRQQLPGAAAGPRWRRPLVPTLEGLASPTAGAPAHPAAGRRPAEPALPPLNTLLPAEQRPLMAMQGLLPELVYRHASPGAAPAATNAAAAATNEALLERWLDLHHPGYRAERQTNEWTLEVILDVLQGWAALRPEEV